MCDFTELSPGIEGGFVYLENVTKKRYMV